VGFEGEKPWRLSHAECESHITPFHKTQYDELSKLQPEKHAAQFCCRTPPPLRACAGHRTAGKERDSRSVESSYGRSSEKTDLWAGRAGRLTADRGEDTEENTASSLQCAQHRCEGEASELLVIPMQSKRGITNQRKKYLNQTLENFLVVRTEGGRSEENAGASPSPRLPKDRQGEHSQRSVG